MSPTVIAIAIFAYFLFLFVIAWITSRNANNKDFFIGSKASPWYIVAYGMIGTSLSGVTFISVPGKVGTAHFAYFQIVIGYLIGYFVIAFVLLPLYYRLNLTSIYSYLKERFGPVSYKTGAGFFILSRTLGATLRLYLVINVLQIFLLPQGFGYFTLAAFVILLMILLYTFKGGVKSIVWTDMLQTTFMLLALVTCVWYIKQHLGLSFGGMFDELNARQYTEVFMTDVMKGNYFLKHIIGGMFITITMTGLDQEMMQKNISCRTLGESQKNMITFSFILVVVNLIFLVLGGVLYLYAEKMAVPLPELSDDLFPIIAMNHLPGIISLIFIIGLISALFPSADGALTALTSSFCIDILGINDKNISEQQRTKTRLTVHLSMAVLFMVFVLLFKVINEKAIIDILLEVAGYTYGPLLGLFMFGILTKRSVQDKLVLYVCIAAPVICYGLNILVNKPKWVNNHPGIVSLLPAWSGAYQIGLEILLINGLLTFGGLYFISKKR